MQIGILYNTSVYCSSAVKELNSFLQRSIGLLIDAQRFTVIIVKCKSSVEIQFGMLRDLDYDRSILGTHCFNGRCFSEMLFILQYVTLCLKTF